MGRLLFGILGAAAMHLGFILFGGLLFPTGEDDAGTLQEVELLSDEDAAQDDEPEEEEPVAEPTSEDVMETEPEEVPDAAEIMRDLELTAIVDAPALEAASLAAIEQALRGEGGGGDFSDALSFASGGRIGGLGQPGALSDELEGAFGIGDIDQAPRALFQTAPLFPAEMRGKKLEGEVTVIFVVDASGKVVDPRVEKSNHRAFERPALEAVRQWKFDPAIKGGERVSCKIRIPIRFRAN